ncbi:MAG: bifunctional demethylmenaquinone methyltransferase/2-methoxy-6-polyprenyl-1,4-benzoquinol methylase UbiE [Bacteroidales bacterium]|nr:bifunctional demethylmenaquinone methyltransferase/2-methoxy-6-polyprenyl-1,4-benzoquinol methylase UbiE [Bacteroidales bacterium]
MSEEKRISRKNVESMFDRIAPDYDKFNHILSAGIDRRWRREVVGILSESSENKYIADFATGTGDLAIALAEEVHPTTLIGLDISNEMLQVAKSKVQKHKLEQIISLKKENCENTSLPDSCMDAVTTSFGIRNFNSPENGLKEMRRVLRPGGKTVILEFSTPRKGLVASFVKWYYNHIIPFVGNLISKTKAPYRYLPATIYEFPDGERFCTMMRDAGFRNVHYKSLTFNMVNIYIGER